MVTSYVHLAECFLAGDLQPFRQILNDTSDFGALNELGFGIYEVLNQRGDVETTLSFILSFCHWQDNADNWTTRFAHRIYAEGDKTAALNLWMHLIKQGKGEAFAYEACAEHCLDRGMKDEALALFAEAQRRYSLADFSDQIKFKIAAEKHSRGEFEQAFDLYTALLSGDPSLDQVRGNIIDLARRANYQPAVDWVDRGLRTIAAKAPAQKNDEPDSPHLVFWQGAENAAIAAAIRTNGFCYLKDGCAPDVAEELRQIGLQKHAAESVFPIALDDEILAKLDGLVLFDPKAVLSLLSASEYTIDRKFSTMRRVSPEETAAATPFHQDSTAFQRSLYNVWVPLTMAGGAYPSIQFVAKLINVAEQTKITDGEYNRVEIDSDFVLAKYGNLLRTIEDAKPGDCVMFYGTTIHRTYGVERASQTRFNLEVRWS